MLDDPAAMDQSRKLGSGVSRRRLLQGAGAAVGAVAAGSVTACGEADETTTQSGGIEGTESDIETLQRALAIEFASIGLYQRGTRLLGGPRRRACGLFLAQEKEHADVLTKAITQLGGSAAVEPAPLGHATLTAPRFLDLAAGVANAAIGVYLAALPRLSSGDLRTTSVTILAVEAEHLSVLRGFLGRPQAPDAFVSGAPDGPR
jgi:rubrerythrin